MLRLSSSVFLVIIGGGCAGAFAQPDAVPAGAAAPVPSAVVQPALGTLRQTVGTISLDRWKGPRALKDTTLANLDSIRKDLDATLPGLLATSDAAPQSASGMLPVAQNLGALYDVLLRVTVSAESYAPAEQTAALEDALKNLEGARRTFAERVADASATQERRVIELQKSLAAKSAPPPVPVAAAPVPCKPAAPVRKKKKPVAPPATAPPN